MVDSLFFDLTRNLLSYYYYANKAIRNKSSQGLAVIFQVDLHSAKPVYQQLIDQVKFAIASGKLKPGDKMAPIREVATSIRVNRNTVAKVYSELEREGLLYSKAGQGSFVSDRGSDLSGKVRREQLTQRIDEILAQARLYEFSREAILELIERRLDKVFIPTKNQPNPIDNNSSQKD